jgi:glutamate-ammonia-ligase adenylyltransferase
MPAPMSATDADYRNLLREQWGERKARGSLLSVRMTDEQVAEHFLYRVVDTPETRRALEDCLPALLVALSDVAEPDRVLVNLARFVCSIPNRHAFFQYLAQNPRAIEILVTLFAGSQFLTEILLRNPESFQRLVEHKRLARLKSVGQLTVEAQAAIAPYTAVDDQLGALRRFQRWELLRIGACDLLGLLDLPGVTTQLSRLADSLVRVCLSIAARQTHTSVDGFAVLALGKLGGGELNYSSDIDLLFIARAQPSTYHALGQWLIEALTRVTPEGFLYRVDMRLRPWGTSGALVTSLDGHIAYLRHHARLWEKQALLKARVIAGDERVGNEFLRQAEPLLFDCTDETIRADVCALKRRIETELRRNGREWGEVKLGLGSIRDVEFVTQYLQLTHGGKHPDVRSPNTLDALVRLFAAGFLSANDYRVLADGYTFLRTVEHHLQIMHYRQTHRLPDGDEQLTQLALRLGFQGSAAGSHFLARYRQHTSAIRAVYERHLEARDPMAPDPPAHPPLLDSYHHLARMDPSYATTFSAEEIRHHNELIQRLSDGHLVEVEAVPLGDRRWRVTIVAYDYLGELSLICGLLFVYGFNILDGDIFTYEPATTSTISGVSRRRARQRHSPSVADTRRKIVDVFTVRSELAEVPPDVWTRYAHDLAALLQELQAGRQREAQGALAKRVAAVLREVSGVSTMLYPVEIEIDNSSSERYTVLRIDAPDTIGFLYEFTNALALNGIYIARVTVDSVGTRVRDTLYVTDAHGQKITSPNQQRELRAATVLVKHFTRLLPHSPNPELALLHFREFIGQLFTRPDWPDELVSLERPEVLDALARLLGVSDFLWDDFLRMQYDNLFPLVRDVGTLAAAKPKAQLQAELDMALRAAPDYEDRRVALNAFKDREMFRIDMRYILGHITEFGQFSAELSDLAEVVVDAAYRLCNETLQTRFGMPCLEDGAPSPIAVCGLGKCGGRELGFASDIELMFIYAGNGQTTGPHVITTAEFYEKLVQEFVQTIQARREGIFEIDLRLRPYGRMGSLAVSLEAFRRYFGPGGPAWAYERQALVKLRPIAGDEELGRQIVALRDEFVYSGEPFDVAAMRAMRERQLRHLVAGGTINAKFSPGGLVDLEYLVQGLQIQHGHRDPSLRLTNTREAMAALAAAGILSPEDYARLREAHIFLRRLINALRMVRGNAKDLTIPPVTSEEFVFLARRLGYGSELARLQEDLTRHTMAVQELSTKLLG